MRQSVDGEDKKVVLSQGGNGEEAEDGNVDASKKMEQSSIN